MTLKHSLAFALTLPLAAVSSLTFAPSAAHAGNEQARVAIESFRGPQAQRLQGAIETGLMNKYYVVPDFSIEDMAKRRGVAMRDPDGMAEVGRALQVKAFLSANVQKRGTWKVMMTVRNGTTGEALGRFVVANRSLGQLESTLAKRTSRQIGALIKRASYTRTVANVAPVAVAAPVAIAPPVAPVAIAAPVASVAPVAVAVPVAAAVEPSTVDAQAKLQEQRVIDTAASDIADVADEPIRPKTKAPPVASLGLETRVFNRSFKHSQNQSGLNDYALSGALSAAMSAELHPFAGSSSALAPVGLHGGLEYGLGVGSRVAGTQERLSTDVHAYDVGLSYALMTGAFTFSPGVGYNLSSFDAGAKSGAPNTQYKVLTPGARLAWAASERLSLRAATEYLYVLSAGPLTASERFPRATVYGAEASVQVAFAVLDSVELAASGGLRRYGIATNVIPGDKAIAGGAVDQTTWLGLGLVYRPRIGGAR